ncbi:MAG: carbon-nitrogen hydrolase [Fibrobacterota bacterium]|nr:MAG: carbon-nitrogen hydrolase [Fibrobacterota bacterium]
MSLPLRVALCQHQADEDPEICWARFRAQAEDAARQGATLIVTQELFMGPYFCQGQELRHFDRAEPIPGPTTHRLQELASRLGCVIVGSLFEKRVPGLYHNTAVVCDADGSLAGIYRKMHIPQDPGFDEKFYFAPGDLGFQAHDTAVGRIGVLICWDQWFPESARLTTLQGAEILLFPTAIAWDDLETPSVRPVQYDAWLTSMRAHAIANGVFVAAPNRIGREGRLEFWGGSFVADPEGRILHQCSHDQPEVAVVECPRDRIENVRHTWPFLRDRRTDAYDGMMSRWGR